MDFNKFRRTFPPVVSGLLLAIGLVYFLNQNISEAKAYFLIGGIPILGYLVQLGIQKFRFGKRNL